MSLTACHGRCMFTCPPSFNRNTHNRRIDAVKSGGVGTGRLRKTEQWRISSSTENEETSTTEIRELPIFPLSVVALPGCVTPLFIFEARYRVLFNTLLAGEPDLEEELIQKDSPFRGTREFGMCFLGEGGMAKVGTVLNVQQHQRQSDGQMVIMNKGVGRFQVLEVLRMQPVVVCKVEMLPDAKDEITTDEIQDLSDEVSELYRNVARLTRKVKGNDLEAYTDPEELQDMDPVELSFWFASLFTESQFEQQKILEERSCRARLQREKKIFDDAVKYLSAASALKGAFQPDP